VSRDLKASGNSARFTSHIRSFEDGHPQFAALQEGSRDPGTIKLNHAIHMKPIRRGRMGPTFSSNVNNCHRATAADADLDVSPTRTTTALRQSATKIPTNFCPFTPEL